MKKSAAYRLGEKAADDFYSTNMPSFDPIGQGVTAAADFVGSMVGRGKNKLTNAVRSGLSNFSGKMQESLKKHPGSVGKAWGSTLANMNKPKLDVESNTVDPDAVAVSNETKTPPARHPAAGLGSIAPREALNRRLNKKPSRIQHIVNDLR